jgi:hypothetical protein
MLIKPHGIALLAGIPPALLLMTFAPAPIRSPWSEASRAMVYFLGAAYVTLVTLSLPLTGRLFLVPNYFLGDLYVAIASKTSGSARSEAVEIVRLCLGSATTLMMYLWPFIFICARSVWCSYKQGESNNSDNREILLATSIVISVSAVTLAMVSMFTASQTLPFEQNRLHGRYFAHLYLLIVWLALMIVEWRPLFLAPLATIGGRAWECRSIMAAIWLLLAVFGPLFLWTFTIYPWDNPEAMPYYRVDQASWKWYGGFRWATYAAIANLGAAALFVLCLRHVNILKIACVACALTFMLGTIQTRLWQREHLAGINNLATTGRFVRTLISGIPDRNVLVIGKGRYGRMAYVLFGLSCECHVAMPTSDNPLTLDQIDPNVSHVVVFGAQKWDFAANVLLSAPEVVVLRVLR